jgi:hypothetical protein
MMFGKLMKACFKMRNFALLSVIVLISYITGYIPFILIGAAGFVYFVMQTMRSTSFQKEWLQQETWNRLFGMSAECEALFRKARKSVGREAKKKMSGVLADKKELMQFFHTKSGDPVREKMVEQALNLVAAYMRLMERFETRRRELDMAGVNEIKARLERNYKKLGELSDYDAVLELNKAIEMDERVLEGIRDEKSENERIGSRLDYIESTVDMFKQRIITDENTQGVMTDIESAVNEAEALETVLNNRGREKMKE